MSLASSSAAMLTNSIVLNVANATFLAAKMRQLAPYLVIEGTYRPSSRWAHAGIAQINTAPGEPPTVALVQDQPGDEVIAEIYGYESLKSGWDGESADAPNPEAIRDAVIVVRAIGFYATHLIPSLDVDGSVLLEIGDKGSLKLKGDGMIVYAIDGTKPGTTKLQKGALPIVVLEAAASL